jgi:3-deoxy-D-manno-octulosonic-acid transferase
VNKYIILFFYRYLIFPFSLIFTLLFLWPFHKKIQAGFRIRKNLRFTDSFINQPIWIHASSGEFEYAKPIIRELKNKAPNQQILVTYFSPSYADRIKSFPGVDFSMPLPLDLPGPILLFLKKMNPKMLLVSRTDLWPELLYQTKRLKIPSLLFSTTFKPLTGYKKLFTPYYRFVFNLFSQIFLVSKADQNNISILNLATPCSVIGDTRYDQVIYRKNQPYTYKKEAFESIVTTEKAALTLIAGSTWAADQVILIPALAPFLIEGSLKLIIAPHEPTPKNLIELEELLKNNKLSFNRYSDASTFSNSVMVIDKVGLLAELYSLGDLAFVGGSFKSKVHSVMEPLAFGLPTFVGPHYENNREATEFKDMNLFEDLHAIEVVENKMQLFSKVQFILKHKDKLTLISQELKKAVEGKSHATEHVIEWLDKQTKI